MDFDPDIPAHVPMQPFPVYGPDRAVRQYVGQEASHLLDSPVMFHVVLSAKPANIKGFGIVVMVRVGLGSAFFTRLPK